MSEEKEYPSYNINVGVAMQMDTPILLKTYKHHPYGLKTWREIIINQVDEWQERKMEYRHHDNLTHAWRTPWDTHHRYPELMSPISSLVTKLCNTYTHDDLPEFYLSECWITDYVNNSGANKHHHNKDKLGWSFCYYVQVPDDGPGFTICDEVNSINYQINVTEGDLLIFRNPLAHQVFPATDRRIIISGNLCENNFAQNYFDALMEDENFLETHNLIRKRKKIDPDNWDIGVFTQAYDWQS